MEYIFGNFIDSFSCKYSANLCLFAEGNNIRLHVMLVSPPFTCHTYTGLHFIKNEEYLIFIAYPSQLFEELNPEMVIAAFTLDGFQYHACDIIFVFSYGFVYFCYCLFFK